MPGEFKRAARKAERNRKENAVRENAPSQHAPEKRISGLKKYFTLGLFGLAALTMKGHEQERFTERARNEALEIYLHRHDERSRLNERSRLSEYLRRADPKNSILFLEYFDVPVGRSFNEWTHAVNNPAELMRGFRGEIDFMKGFEEYADLFADFVERGGKIAFVEEKNFEEESQYQQFQRDQLRSAQRMADLIPKFVNNQIPVNELMNAYKNYLKISNNYFNFREEIMVKTILEKANANPDRNSLMLLIGSQHDEVARRTKERGIATTLLREKESMPKTYLEQFMERLNKKDTAEKNYRELSEQDKQLLREAFFTESLETSIQNYAENIKIQNQFHETFLNLVLSAIAKGITEKEMHYILQSTLPIQHELMPFIQKIAETRLGINLRGTERDKAELLKAVRQRIPEQLQGNEDAFR